MKFIVSYDVSKKINNKPERFEGFSVPYLYKKFKQKDDYNIIDLEKFKSLKFNDEDIVIIPFFNRHHLQLEHKMLSEQLVEIFGDNLFRENTLVILGTHAESNGNQVRGDDKLLNTEAGDLIYSNIQKNNQKVKLIVDGSNTYGMNKPNDSKSSLVSAQFFVEWAETLMNDYKGKEIFQHNLKNIEKLQDRDKTFTCLQRRPRQCRVINLYNIYNQDLQDTGYYSLRLNSLDSVRHWKFQLLKDREWRVESDDWINFNTKFKDFLEIIKEHGDYTCDEANLYVNQAFDLNQTHYLNSYFQVVAETLTNSHTIFFTEKIYKPIICGSPFFVLGNRHSLKSLQNLGFKTFSDWWDESYDEYYSHYERSKKVFSIVKDLSNKPKSYLNSMLLEQKEILVHNHNNMIKLINDNYYIDDMLDILVGDKK